MTDQESSASTTDQASDQRRNFLVQAGSIVIGGLISMFGLLSGLLVFIDPLIRKRPVPLAHRDDGGAAGPEGYVKVATLDMVPADGVARRFPVIDDQIDAWNFSPDQPIGAVYLRRTEDDDKLKVLHATCPHAGCAVSLKANADPGKSVFHCPCHNSAFNLSGERINLPGKENPSPREMDELKVDEKLLADRGEIWIKFENYYTGRHDKKPMI